MAPAAAAHCLHAVRLKRSRSISFAPTAPQISLDMNTPLEVVEMLRGTVDTHVKANAADFSGASSGALRRGAAAAMKSGGHPAAGVCE